MYLGQIECEPAELLKSLHEARRTLEVNRRDLLMPIDCLIDQVVSFLQYDGAREMAVANARKVAAVFEKHGADLGRQVLGVPPADPELKKRMLRYGKGLAERLNHPSIDVPDDADISPTGAGWWVTANLFIPVDTTGME